MTSPIGRTMIGIERLDELISHRASPSLSLYMPLEHGREARKNPIVLKNLLREADELLAERRSDADVRAALLAPLFEMVAKDAFPLHAHGLAMYRAPDRFTTIERMDPFEPAVVVDDRFHLKPLLATLAADARFYILALSLNAVKVVEATRDEAREVGLSDDTPRSLADAASIAGEPELQFYTASPRDSRPVYHGQGEEESRLEGKIHRFFRDVDAGAAKVIDTSAPVVLACVERLQPLFRSAARHLKVVDGAVTGNPDVMSEDELRRAAWPLVREAANRRLHEVALQAERLEATERVVHDIEDVLQAAEDGRIETLMVPADDSLWGHFDRGRRTVEVLDERAPDADELYELAVAKAYATGADIHVLDSNSLPGRRPTAILRY